MDDSDTHFDDLAKEFEFEIPKEDEDTEEKDDTQDDVAEDDKSDDNADDGNKADDDAKTDDADDEADDDKADDATDDDKVDDDKVDDSTEPEYATKDDVKSAFREFNQEQTQRISTVKSAQQAVLEKIAPDGLDRNIYDSDGNVVHTAQDIIDRGLFNPKTQAPFESYEEAASWMMDAQKTKNEEAERLESQAEALAELNVNLMEDQQRVVDQWGDTLKAMPEVAKRLADTYVRHFVKSDPKTEMIVEVAKTPTEFYNEMVPLYVQAAEAQAEAERIKTEYQAKATQDERVDLPARGRSKSKANTGRGDLDALLDEFND